MLLLLGDKANLEWDVPSNDIKATRRIVLYPGKDEFKLDPLTTVMNVAELLPEIRARRKP